MMARQKDWLFSIETSAYDSSLERPGRLTDLQRTLFEVGQQHTYSHPLAKPSRAYCKWTSGLSTTTCKCKCVEEQFGHLKISYSNS